MKKTLWGAVGVIILIQASAWFQGDSFQSVYVEPIENGDVAFAREALSQDVRNHTDWSLLQYAVLMDNLPMLETLIQAGADPSKPFGPYENAIDASVRHESANTTKYFQDRGFDITLYIKRVEFEKQQKAMQERTKEFAKSGDGYARSLLINTLNSPDSYDEKSEELVWAGQDEKGRPAGIYKFEFSAQNGFGASLRGCRYVSFWLNPGDKVGYYNNTYVQSCDSWGDGDDQAAVDTLVRLNFQRETQLNQQ
ncbi:hypothetical protein GCM10017044_19590 [Kordiimonas sediminis]|uniref:Ankyrin repeat domain-containing protein n=1 Tax=Kordiimonas sediminis TaxID=1735581 RepID=A0A919E6U9_9PROT|nr:ankyrin repeat domain-containing protein [Kordiimonas sediminis]GHF24909.1 hypothetical protein GCM10017044_19590 [Kordiimonas sediminis]